MKWNLYARYLQKRTDWKIVVPVLKGHGEQLRLEEATSRKLDRRREKSVEKTSS